MVTSSITKRRKVTRANALVRKAATILRGKNRRLISAPLASRGFQPYRYGGGSRSELKYVDNSDNDEVILDTGKVLCMNLMASGTNVSQRVGRKVDIKSILLNFNIFNSKIVSAGAPQGAIVRVSLVYDSQPNGAVAEPAYTDIYAADHPTAPLNLNNRDRFRVLWTKVGQIGAFVISNITQLATGAPQNVYKKMFKMVNLPVIFGGPGGTIGDIQTGSLLLCFVADITNVTYTDYYCRVRYADN